MSIEVLRKLDQILENTEIPDRHTFFQLKNFIIGKEYTVQGQLWQVVRELRSRKETMESLELQIADSEDNLELIDIKTQILDMESEKAILKEQTIQKRKLSREKIVLQKGIEKLRLKIRYILEEVSYLSGAFETLSKIETMKPLDDIVAQKQYWNEKLATHLNLKLLLKNPIDTDFVNTILALDDDAPVKQQMLGILQKVQQMQITERDRQRSLIAEVEAAKLPRGDK